MRIGVLTYFKNANYGAMLQAYALWSFLAARNHEVTFLDYDFGLSYQIPVWRCFISRSLKGVKGKLKHKVRAPITQFSKCFQVSRFLPDHAALADECSKYDAIVVGSDQVWNPTWVIPRHDINAVFLGVVPDGIRKIAYAPSFGVTAWPTESGEEVTKCLKRFEAISVRENVGAIIVERLVGRRPVVVLDPTLLLETLAYKAILEEGSAVHDEYIFRYFLDEWSDGADEFSACEACRSITGIKIVIDDRVPVRGVLGIPCRLLGVKAKVQVPVWLSRLANSSFVLTNSYHGTIFSIIFHRPFVSLLLPGFSMNERIVTLLTNLGLESRMCNAYDKEAITRVALAPIDWSAIEERLHDLRSASMQFIASAGL